MALKKLHSLLVRSFIPPFIITLFVSVFLFFLVEVVITYLDDFIGKGLGFWTLSKLFFYAWLAIIPKCIPLAVLLSSIMTLGSLAENYELAAMKSSGLSLFRIIKPLFVSVLILAGLTFIFNNYILPKVTLESEALLWDIRQAKPALNIKEGIFDNKIKDYSMRVGKKMPDNKTLRDIKIYDHTKHLGNTIQLYADSGYMTTSADTNYLIIQLNNGNRYEEMTPDYNNKTKKPMMQLNFKELTVNVELTDFKLKRTNTELFKHYSEVMNIWQINHEIDSCDGVVNKRKESLKSQAKSYFFYRTYSVTNRVKSDKFIKVKDFYQALDDSSFNVALDATLNNSRSSGSFIDATIDNVKSENVQKNEFKIGWHEKINVCFACIILFFVGAPLGAIIRKGGLGLPVVVAVFFFLAYFILTQAFASLAHEEILTPFIGSWAPLFIFLPLGIFLTYKAATDSALFDLDIYLAPVKRLFASREKKQNS